MSANNFISADSKVIAVDFDGTIVTHAYPQIGKEMLFAFATLKELQSRGHKLILWTFRSGELLDEAVEYCRKNGVEFYAVNKNYPEEVFSENISRKVNADIFIDDRNVGGFRGWSETWQMLHPDGGNFFHVVVNPDAHSNYTKEEKSFFKRFLGK
jgi:hydroxymethylpyrimidine pyrophosphatase-like HAD family hydrolase